MKNQRELLDKYTIIKPTYRGQSEPLCHEILKIEAVGGRNVTVKILPLGSQHVVDVRALWILEAESKYLARQIIKTKEDLCGLIDGFRIVDSELFSDVQEIVRQIQHGEVDLVRKLQLKTNALYIAHDIKKNAEALLQHRLANLWLDLTQVWEKETKKWSE